MAEEVEIIEEDEEVVYEEEQAPHVIETGDSVKVKQVFDDSVGEAINEMGFKCDYRWENLKLLMMCLSCGFAVVAQFYPTPFPDSRPLLAFCCASYFLISTVLQIIISYIDGDTILFTLPSNGLDYPIRIRTDFPRFQEYYTFTVQFKDSKDERKTIGKMYVGKYFTAKGEYDEEAFKKDVTQHVQKFVDGKYLEVEYNHKKD